MRFGFGDVVEGFFESKTCVSLCWGPNLGLIINLRKWSVTTRVSLSPLRANLKFGGVRFYTLEMHNY